MVADHQGGWYQGQLKFRLGRVQRGDIVKFTRRSLVQFGGGAAILSLFSRGARADIWPSRVIKLEVGFPPGGGLDAAGRIAANRLSDLLGQQMIVENRPGAGGRIAMDAAAHAAPDGYTVLLGAGAPAVNSLLFEGLSFDPLSLQPVTLIGTYPNLIVVPNSSKFAKLGDLIAYAKANPGKVTWASPGVGSIPHLAGELFMHMAGIDITHVPYRGVAAGAMTDLLSGRLDAMFNTTGSLLPAVNAKQVRCLAVTSAQRFPIAPDLPTVAESGVPGYEDTSWYALYVPGNTPADVIAKINAASVKMLAEDATKAKYAQLGILATSSSPEKLAALNAGDVKRWGPIIKAAGIKGE
jgi:tripartite-type tricarboxylate transporter receptor subunit TctC